MSQQEQAMQQPAARSGRMIAVLGGIAMLSGFLVVLTSQLTKPIIEENQRRAVEEAVLEVVPKASYHREYQLTDAGLKPVEKNADGIVIYAGYDEQHQLKGIAARGAAQGYADMVYILWGYSPKCECVHGMKVLKLAETPGLGDKIITDAHFRANFYALDAKLNDDGSALANPIVAVKHGAKQEPWQIDAISGATISSKAVAKAINQAAGQVLPKLIPVLDQLAHAEENQ